MDRPCSALAGAFFLLFGLVIWPEQARAEAVDLELVLAVDVSGSITEDEFKLQMEGFAEGFRHPKVHEAILGYTANGIAITLVQWSGHEQLSQATDWFVIKTPADALAFADVLAGQERLFKGATAVGDAITYSAGLMEFNAYEGKRKVIDVSGDGAHNQGESPAFARARATKLDITINGLAILNEEPRLDFYYRAGVVGGKGAFLEIADDFDAFPAAIRRKLQREISGTPVAVVPDPRLHQQARNRPF